MKDDFFAELKSTQHSENYLRHLANAFAQLAKTRLTIKQRYLLFAASQTLRHYPNLSPTALAEFLARKLQIPLSTTKFNLNVLKKAGLLEIEPTNDRRSTICLSCGGQLLTQLINNPETEYKNL